MEAPTTGSRTARRSRIKSTDNGLTWQPAKVGIARLNLDDFLTEPYLTQVVAEPPRDGYPERFHFVWTLAAGLDLFYNASGTLTYNYHNGFSKNLYHAYFVPGEDSFYSMDGTNLGETIDGTEMDTHCVVKITGDATVPPVPMTWAQHQALMAAPSRTSIMGNIATIDGTGHVIVNGTYEWSGAAWLENGASSSDIRFMEWRDGTYYGYGQSGAAYKSGTGLGAWTEVGNIFDDLAGLAKLPAALQHISGSVRITATTAPSHPAARFWFKKYGSTDYIGYVVLGGHTSSGSPYRILAQANPATVSSGAPLTLRIYLTDEWGARVAGHSRTVNLSTTLPGTFPASVRVTNGRAEVTVTPTASAAPGEYRIQLSGTGLETSSVYVTVQ
ncbi:MAG: hypothetical protein QM765_37355 [Myxococcales bacterium]